MTSAGAIALAEFLPESASLLHLDLTMNSIDIAGVMALSSGLKANHVMRCLDLNIPPADEEMARYVILKCHSYEMLMMLWCTRMCRDILESCVRNTEEAEKASQGGLSGRGEAKGVWGMIEQSELAKSIREDDKKKVDERLDVSSPPSRNPTDIPSPSTEQTDSDFVTQCRARKDALEDLLARSPSSSSSSPASPVSGPDAELVESTREMMKSLVITIERTTDPSNLETLLALNDDLMSVLGRLEHKPPRLTLQGLGLDTGATIANGHTTHSPAGNASPAQGKPQPSDDEDGSPITPRVDKGKGRAEPEPEPVESILSPTFLISESDDEDGDPPIPPDELEGFEDLVSPTDL